VNSPPLSSPNDSSSSSSERLCRQFTSCPPLGCHTETFPAEFFCFLSPMKRISAFHFSSLRCAIIFLFAQSPPWCACPFSPLPPVWFLPAPNFPFFCSFQFCDLPRLELRPPPPRPSHLPFDAARISAPLGGIRWLRPSLIPNFSLSSRIQRADGGPFQILCSSDHISSSLRLRCRLPRVGSLPTERCLLDAAASF